MGHHRVGREHHSKLPVELNPKNTLPLNGPCLDTKLLQHLWFRHFDKAINLINNLGDGRNPTYRRMFGCELTQHDLRGEVESLH